MADMRLTENRPPRLSTLAVGTINEMVVAVDLVNRSVDVFRSVAVIAKFDMLARCRTTGKILAIEAKTAQRGKKGYVSYPRKDEPLGEGEHYALVFSTGEVEYVPPLPADFGLPYMVRGNAWWGPETGNRPIPGL